MVSALTANNNPALICLLVCMHGDMRCQRFHSSFFFFSSLLIKSRILFHKQSLFTNEWTRWHQLHFYYKEVLLNYDELKLFGCYFGKDDDVNLNLYIVLYLKCLNAGVSHFWMFLPDISPNTSYTVFSGHTLPNATLWEPLQCQVLNHRCNAMK